MKEWKNPEMWELAAEYTEGSLTGEGEDHQRVHVAGLDLWGNS